METSSVMVQPGVEVGSIVHDGRTFTALGAVGEAGDERITAYRRPHPQKPGRVGEAGTGEITTWGGVTLGSYRVVSRYRHNWSSWNIPKMLAIRATIGGVSYHARCSSEWDVVTLYKSKGVQ